MFESTNRKRTISDKIDTKSWPKEAFKKLDDLVGRDDVCVWGYMITSGDYGKSLNLVCSDQSFRKMPERCIQNFEQFTDEEREYIMSGQKLHVERYKTKKGNNTFNVRIGDYDM